jgi:hypothetical protein
MKTLLLTGVTVLVLVSTAIAQDKDPKTYTYMCKVDHKLYPVSVNEVQDKLTWRGQTYSHITLGGCKREWIATRNGVTVSLCAATKGVATLELGGKEFGCRMPGSPFYGDIR